MSAVHDGAIENVEVESLSDGFAMTYGRTDRDLAKYNVRVERQFGDKTFVCTSSGSKKREVESATAFCKSLTGA